MASNVPSAGICYVTSKPKDPTTLPDAQFNDFYNNEHVPDMLRYGFAPLALRYQNADPESPHAYLALYPQDDVDAINSPTTAKMIEECRYARLLDGRDHHQLIAYTVSAWTKIHTFDGPAASSSTARAATLVAVAIEPAAGAEADLDAWYREQHLPLLAACRHYRRCTRYRRVGEEAPRFMALHEWACGPEELPEGEIGRTRETEWSRRVLAGARVVEREVWGLIGEWGDVGRAL